jgi:hypothetical protein
MLTKALNYVKSEISFSKNEINKMICKAMQMRCPVYLAYPNFANEIDNLLADFCEDNECENDFDIEEIIENL